VTQQTASGKSSLNKPSVYNTNRMPRKRTVKLRCPICKKSAKSTDPDFPFCSDRCRVIDLGKWASGAYVISSPTADTEEGIRDRNLEDVEDEE
jgi:endogenous inhibitor of DNA gyrase (YacG/DUF329 family)